MGFPYDAENAVKFHRFTSMNMNQPISCSGECGLGFASKVIMIHEMVEDTKR